MELLQPNEFMAWQLMTHKIIHGRTVFVTKWDARIHSVSYLEEDGVILTPRAFEFSTVYPTGLCECGQCGAFWIPRHYDAMYWDFANLRIVCNDCKVGLHTHSICMVNVDPTTAREAPNVTVQSEEQCEEAPGREHAEMMAERLGMHYFQGKTAQDLYQDLLGRRVVRRWRRMMKRNLIYNTAKVLHSRLCIPASICANMANRGISFVS